MMYQAVWTRVEDGVERDGYMFSNDWEEIEAWTATAEEDEAVKHWTVSMVLHSSAPLESDLLEEPDEPERVMWRGNAVDIALMHSVDSEDTEVRGMQVMNVVSLLPPRLKDEEVFATLMHIASNYVQDPRKLTLMLRACAESANDYVEHSHEAKKAIRKFIN
jgi:hypothetical protein